MQALFYLDPLPTILIILVAIAAPLGAVRLAWGAWLAFYAHLVVRERDRIETQRQALDLALVRPDAINGLLPIVRAQLELSTGPILDLMLARIQSMAAPANVPQSIHLAPHIMQRPAPALPAPQDEEIKTMTVEPRDLWQLYHADQLPHSGFLLGHNLDNGEPVTAAWDQLYSALVGGTSGSGKSTLIRSVLLQSALQGGRFVVLDRHYGAGAESLGESLQPLRSLMPFDVAANERQMVDALHYVLDVGRRRLHGDPDRQPLVMVVDETTALFQRSDIAGELATVLGEISQETRKAAVYALCIGQNFSAEVMKTTVRNSFASFFSCRARRDVARMMSGSTRFAQMAEELKIGQAVWLDAGGEVVRLAVPNCTQRHVNLVARQCAPTGQWIVPALLPEPAETEDTRQENGQEGGSDAGSEDYRSISLKLDSARVARVKAAIKGGMSKGDILRDVWGVDMRKGGRRVTQASVEYDEIVRALIA